MIYEELSPQGEQLLAEIIELKNTGKDESTHWIKRFESLSFDEDTILPACNPDSPGSWIRPR